MMDSFPDSVSDADIAQLLEPVALLDEKIEEQIGCRIVEVGEVIPVPDGAPQGWNEDEQRYRRTCPVLADEGQILGFTMDDENHGSPEAQGQANSSCGTFSYLRPVLEIWPCPGCEVDALTACGGTRVSAEDGQSSRWGRGARLTRRVREEPPPGELARVYFDRNATQNAAKRSGSAGMDRRLNAASVSPQAV